MEPDDINVQLEKERLQYDIRKKRLERLSKLQSPEKTQEEIRKKRLERLSKLQSSEKTQEESRETRLEKLAIEREKRKREKEEKGDKEGEEMEMNRREEEMMRREEKEKKKKEEIERVEREKARRLERLNKLQKEAKKETILTPPTQRKKVYISESSSSEDESSSSEEETMTGNKKVEEDNFDKKTKDCKLFIEEAKKVSQNESFINPLTKQVIRKGSVNYNKYLKDCEKYLGIEQMREERKILYPEREIVGERKFFSCDGFKRRGGFVPKPHQERVRDRFVEILESKDKNDTLRGFLLYHGLGVGKTCSYSMIIDEYLERYPENYIFIFTKGALRTNMIEQYCSFCGKNPDLLVKRLIFYTLNDTSVLNKIKLIDFNNSLIIIDELHNLTHGVKNESPIYTDIYNKIIFSENSYIVGGSGTPIETDITELYYMANLFNPGVWYTLDYYLNEYSNYNSEDDFNNEEKVYRLKNPEEFKAKICRFISYFMPNEDMSDYPLVTEKKVIVGINPERQKDAIEMFIAEYTFPPNPKDKFRNPKKYARDKMRYYLYISHIKTSQNSNFKYPKIGEDKINEYNETIEGIAPNLKIKDLLKEKNGWITEDIIDDLDKNGEKINVIINDIIEHEGKHAIYTRFKQYYGSRLIGAILDIMDIPYRYFDGDMDDNDRIKVLSEFNDPKNNDGSKIKVIILTDAGAEGINLLAVRRFHILEQGLNMTKMKQITGRANRFKSHSSLPIDKRNLTILNYFLTFDDSKFQINPENFDFNNEDLKIFEDILKDNYDVNNFSPDYVLYKSARKKDKSISELREIMKVCST